MRRLILLPLLLALVTFLTHSGEAGTHAAHSPFSPRSSASSFQRSVWLGANRLFVLLNNRGGLDFNTPYIGAAFWPDTTDYSKNVVVFDCGPWVLGKLNGKPKMGFSEWGSSYSPGPVIDGQAAMIAKPADSLRYRLYKINKGDNAFTNPDYKDWPADLGAPLDAQGNPRLYGDQTVWTVFNNLDTTVLSDSWKAWMPVPGLPVEIRQTVYEHSGKDSARLLDDVAFFEWTIINTGDAPIESTYVSLWTDIDFNDAVDNKPAVDTVNQLGYCWQSRDYQYGPPRAVGFVWLFGPSVPSPGDQAIFRGAVRPNYRNLPITSFWGIGDDSTPDSSFFGPAYSMGTAWNIARGFDKAGNPILDSVTHQVTKFPYSGDPVTGTGWLSKFSSGGAGFNIFSGPFTMAPHDTQWAMAALVPVTSPDRLTCVTLLRERAATLRSMSYDHLTSVAMRPAGTEIPSAVMLDQNYPNPFNPSTTIRYALPRRSQMRLTVFDVLGQEVLVLVDGEVEAGYHEVQFDAGILSSGVYFYRLHAGDYAQTKKLLLLR
jgi:hypothetical protein